MEPITLNIQQDLLESPHRSSCKNESKEDVQAIDEPDLPINNGENNEAVQVDADHQIFEADLGICDVLI